MQAERKVWTEILRSKENSIFQELEGSQNRCNWELWGEKRGLDSNLCLRDIVASIVNGIYSLANTNWRPALNLEWIVPCILHMTGKNTLVREANSKYISSISELVSIVKNNETDEENKGWSPLSFNIAC